MSTHLDPDLAAEIVRYLLRHPQAADSVEGIRQWWLPAQGPGHTPQQVEAALAWLLERGLVRCEHMPDGRTLYRSGEGPTCAEPHT